MGKKKSGHIAAKWATVVIIGGNFPNLIGEQGVIQRIEGYGDGKSVVVFVKKLNTTVTLDYSNVEVTRTSTGQKVRHHHSGPPETWIPPIPGVTSGKRSRKNKRSRG